MSVFTSNQARFTARQKVVLIAGALLLGPTGPALAERDSEQTPAVVSEELRQLNERLSVLDRRFGDLERQLRSQTPTPILGFPNEAKSWIEEYKEQLAQSGN